MGRETDSVRNKMSPPDGTGRHKCKSKITFLSHDVAVIQCITSCHKNRMTTRVITLRRERVTS